MKHLSPRPGERPALYPHMLAQYPMLAMAAANWRHLDPKDLLVPLAATLALSLACHAIATWMVPRRASKQGVLALLFVVFITWYGFFLSAVRESWILVPLARPLPVLVGWCAVIGGTALLVYRSDRSFVGPSRWLDRFAILFLLFPLASIAASIIQPRGSVPVARATSASTAQGSSSHESTRSPDVYVLILDKYSASRHLEADYGHDNRSFVAALRERGFFVPANARANYVHTLQSVASMLNWTYLDDVAERAGLKARDRTPLEHMLKRNRAERFFRNRGYVTVFLPSSYPPLSEGQSEFVLRFDASGQRTVDFHAAWMEGTLLAPVTEIGCEIASCDRNERSFPYPIESREEILWKLDQLAELSRDSRPTYVFAHLLVPHEPYIFRRDCEPREPWWPRGDRREADRIAAAYAEQVACVNHLLLDLIDRILSNSATKPVIVLQSDHGHGRIAVDPLRGENVPLEDLSAREIAERASVFAAYRVPGESASFHDGITPINVLPIVLNSVFDAGIPMQPDHTFWLEYDQPFRYTRIR